MARKARFPLVMDNGIEVSSVEELREHFSIVKVNEYFANGKLLRWLRDRYFEDEADAVEKLSSDDPALNRKLCEIFNVEYDESFDVNTDDQIERGRRLELLKSCTNDERFYNVIDQVAFDQDDLYDILDDGADTVYICGEKISIPLGKRNVTYIGIGTPTVHIDSKVPIDFERRRIRFKEIKFDNAYNRIANPIDEAKSEDDAEPLNVSCGGYLPEASYIHYALNVNTEKKAELIHDVCASMLSKAKLEKK